MRVGKREVMKREKTALGLPPYRGICLPDAILGGKVIGSLLIFTSTVAAAADQRSSVGRGHELGFDCGVARVAKIANSGRGIETLVAVNQQSALTLRRDGRQGWSPTRGATAEGEIHLTGVDRVAAHALEHSAAIGVLLKTSRGGLVVQEVWEQGSARGTGRWSDVELLKGGWFDAKGGGIVR